MEYYRQEIKAGALVVVSFLILCFLLFNVTNFKAKSEHYYYTVSFTNLSGLMVNAPVQYAGVNVGKVEWIKIQNGKKTVVDLGISVKKYVPLKNDSKVTITSSGFVGEKFVSITPGSASSATLKNNATMRGIDPTDMVMLIERINNVLNELNIEQLGKELREIFVEARSMVADAKVSFAKIKKIVVQIEQSGKVQKVLNDTSDLIVKFQNFTKNVDQVVLENKDGIKNSVDNIEEMSTDIKVKAREIMADLRDVVKRVDEIIADNQTDISSTIKNANQFTEVVKREPWRLFWKETTDKYFKDRKKKKEEKVEKIEEQKQPVNQVKSDTKKENKKIFPPFF
ncbi:MAG: MlaD family protein [Candidatus Ancaeobacter aquaticus]|nr:MlaD family protein [Candidatus Ancaeobacter aquaticus]